MGMRIKRAILALALLGSLFQDLPAAAIHEAVKKGDLAGVRELLAKDPACLNAEDELRRTPLHLAAAFKRKEIFQHLLAAGADVNRPDAEGFSPLLLVCYAGLDGWIAPLLQKGAAVDANANVLGYTPLHAAARGGHARCAELLLARGARLDLRDKAGNTPLLLAAASDRPDAAILLLAEGAPCREKNDMGNSPLHLAALRGGVPLVEALLKAGAAVDERNRYGNTPLAIAEREGHEAAAGALRAAGAEQSPRERAEPKGEYLGQPQPGAIPALFAPGIVSTEKGELNSVFTPDGREFYFTVQKVPGTWTIMVMKREGDLWSGPQAAAFSGVYSDVDMFIAPDGGTLYFCSNRPRPDGVERPGNYDIWMVERRGGGWSEPLNPGAPLNSDQDEFFPSLTRDGAIYFQSRRPESGGGAHIYRARREAGAPFKVEKLGAAINCEPFIGDTLVAPDESWAILSLNRPSGFGQGDLCVSFRGEDGSWTEPRNLGSAINTKANENCPILTPDGRYLFYTSGGDIYWVAAEVIEALRPRAAREPMTLARIANSGVMLASGKAKVLIDALFEQAPPDYRSPEREVIEKIVSGAAPFDGIGLALVTHDHPDHFAAPLAARFLEANPAARLLAPENAVAEMRKEKGWANIASRVIALDLKTGETAQREIAGVSLAARRTLHSGKKEEPANLMFRLRVNGWSVFHEGDADATPDEYRGFGLAEAKVDLALVHFWFPLHPETATLLQEVIRPAHIALTHLPIRLEGDAPGKIDMVRQHYKDVFLLLPGMPAKTFTDKGSGGG